MEHQAHVQVDGDVGDVPAKLEGEPAAGGKRSKKCFLVSRPAVPDGCRNGPRYIVTIWRAVGTENRRTEREAVPTTEYLGTSKLPDQRHCTLCARARRCTSPSQHVHVCETHGASA